MRRTIKEKIYEKIDLIIFLLCIVLIQVACALLYADGVVRDRYNVQLMENAELSLNLLILIMFTILFWSFRQFFKYRQIKNISILIFIPIFLFSIVTSIRGTMTLIDIIADNSIQKTVAFDCTYEDQYFHFQVHDDKISNDFNVINI